MVCTANEVLGWTDFPKGLRVLLLDQDNNSATEIKSKLEEMDYIVSTFCNEDEALSAISNEPDSFHIAIVELSSNENHKGFKFLEVGKDLPTIMTSTTQCQTTMMKCIGLGAVEFLLKPLSDDKLRTLWQHVVHKAFRVGGKEISESLKPLKESVDSTLRLQLENGEQKRSIFEETEHEIAVVENGQERSVGSEKYPAPPTPQLKQGVRLVDDGDGQYQTISSAEKESRQSKSVDTTSANVSAETTDSTVRTIPPKTLEGTVVKEEDESPDSCKSDSNNVSSCRRNKDYSSDSGGDAGHHVKGNMNRSTCGNKANRKKMKVEWTPELHKKFVMAVEQLGVDKAIPSRILDLMKVGSLTRHNVASHLQKYRMQRRHILPKEDVRRWPHPRDPSQRGYYPHKLVMAYPLYHPYPIRPPGEVHPAWQPPSSHFMGIQAWGPPIHPPWPPAEGWNWKPYPGMHVDAWGCPVIPPPPHGPCPAFPQYAAGYNGADATHNSYGMQQNFLDFHLEEEVIDKVVKEAISKPWLPLPIGLNPPSTDSVLFELSKQGISTIPPPHINSSRRPC